MTRYFDQKKSEELFFLVNKSVKGMYAGLWVSFFGLFLNALAMAKSPPRHICIYFPVGVPPLGLFNGMPYLKGPYPRGLIHLLKMGVIPGATFQEIPRETLIKWGII